jgi:hypothetical protein
MFTSSIGMGVFTLCPAYPSFLQQLVLGPLENMRDRTHHLTKL